MIFYAVSYCPGVGSPRHDTHMVLNELQDLALHQALHNSPLLKRERKWLEHALQVRQRVEHEKSLVPARPLPLLLVRAREAHLDCGVDHLVEDVAEARLQLFLTLVAEQRGLVHEHHLAQHLGVVEDCEWGRDACLIQILYKR